MFNASVVWGWWQWAEFRRKEGLNSSVTYVSFHREFRFVVSQSNKFTNFQ